MITTILICISIAYLLLIGSFVLGFDAVEEFSLQDIAPKTRFSIVIPFRNEAQYLPRMLQSLSSLNYPQGLYEVILVDDNSEDNSVALIETHLRDDKAQKNPALQNIQIIKNERQSGSPKKDAITTALQNATYEWIITSDADCTFPRYWLDAFDEFIQTHSPNCVVAPIKYTNGTSFFKRFQATEILSLQGATIGGFGLNQPFMSNGANFAYCKSDFIRLKGFEGNSDSASGDDIFLLHKFLKSSKLKVRYLKCKMAIVSTFPEATFKALVQQHLRWASKTSTSSHWFSKLVGGLVILGNLGCVSLIPLFLMNLISLRVAILLFILKFCIDFLLLFKASRFFNQEQVLFSYILSSVLYPFFSLYIVILTFFKSYEWKGRSFKK
ncbi:glycosyltransferase [Winogradskyella aurantia]|uniref:Glycosyltransferase n=1 Tax=Winogradskyella aurantia TaxID=1915063 RepID=A0A265UVM1_9FLAO|nr:glycosyltransferase [Winogradskyella aurantia]OZV69365.1 glycosyltransferase [Winogradskyella aurantia]